MNLQRFAYTAVAGTEIIYLYRLQEEPDANGVRTAFATENTKTVSTSADSTKTKDGSIRTPSTAEITIKSESILAKEDEMVDKLEKAQVDNKLLEIWEVNLAKPAEGKENKFSGTYFQGYLTSCEVQSQASGYVKLSMTFGVNGKGQPGDVTVDKATQDEASYVFTDAVAKTSDKKTPKTE